MSMIALLDRIVDALREYPVDLGCHPDAIVRGRFGGAGGLDLGIVRPPGVAVFLLPGDMAAVTAAGTAIDDPAFTLVVGVAAPPAADTAEALASAYERARAVPGVLSEVGIPVVWAADAIEPLEIKSDRALVAITGLVYDRGL